jgi:hypothetical protein
MINRTLFKAMVQPSGVKKFRCTGTPKSSSDYFDREFLLPWWLLYPLIHPSASPATSHHYRFISKQTKKTADSR